MVMTIQEVMAELRASRATVYRLRRNGALKTVQVPNVGPRITEASVRRLLETKEVAA